VERGRAGGLSCGEFVYQAKQVALVPMDSINTDEGLPTIDVLPAGGLRSPGSDTDRFDTPA